MALNGKIEDTFCNGYVTLSAEWTANLDILAGTVQYSVSVYVDTSKCHHVTVTLGSGNALYNRITLAGQSFTFNSPDYLSVGKTKLTSFTTEPVFVGETAPNHTLKVEYCPEYTIKAFTTLTSYVESSHRLSISGKLNVDEMQRSSVSNIYGDHTLGIENELSVTRYHADFKHSIEYSCGAASGLITSETQAETFKFAMPVSLAEQNKTGTSVQVTFKVTTHYSGEVIGTKSVVKTYTIPESVKPSCSLLVTEGVYRDGQPLKDIYGGYVRGRSRFKITVNPVLAYGSEIVSYKINANDKVFEEQETTTNLIKYSGSNTITATVTDARGRTSETAIIIVDVLPYSNPVVTDVSAMRYKLTEDGEYIQDHDGGYIKVVFSAEVSPIDSKNTATYFVSHQMSTGLEPYEEQAHDYDNEYIVEGGEFIFEAKTGVDYTVSVRAVDDFGSSEPKSSGGVATTILMHLLTHGLGLCFGGLGTLENCFENKFLTFPSGGFMFPMLEEGTTIHNITTPNIYKGENAEGFDHMPTDLTGAFILMVLPYGSASDYLHIVISTEPKIYIRTIVDSSLGSWKSLTSA